MPSCGFHAYEGKTPCPWCAEKAGVLQVGEWTPPAHACRFCGSPERRHNEVAGYWWCGACGKRVGGKAASQESRDALL